MNRHLKIIIFEGSSKPPVFIKRLGNGLVTQGHELWFLHSGNKVRYHDDKFSYISLGGKGKFYFILKSIILSIKNNPGGLSKTLEYIIQGKRDKLNAQNLNFILKKIKPDVIHVQWPSLLDSLEGVIEENKFPILLSQRGYQINVKPFVNQTYFQKIAGLFPQLAGFHSVSKAISGRGDSIWKSATKLDEVIYTGLDLQNFTFNQNYTPNKKLKIISVGRPHWKKGLHDAIHALGILEKKNLDFEYIIVGGRGNEEILFLTNMYKIEKDVKILGKLPKEKVYELIAGADVMVVSSVEEGIPNVLVEAMAMGLPVISTSCGGVEELIIHGQEGWVVPPRDPKALASRIEAFSNLSVEAIESVRQAARKKVEHQHSHLKMIANMGNLYRKAMVKKKV